MPDIIQTNIILKNIANIIHKLSNNESIPREQPGNIIVEQRLATMQIISALSDILKLDIENIFINENGHAKSSVRFPKNTLQALGMKNHTVELVVSEEYFYIVFMINGKLADGTKLYDPVTYSGREKTYKPQIGIKISMTTLNKFHMLEIARKRAILTSHIAHDAAAQALLIRLKSIKLYLEAKLQKSIESDLISKPFISSNFIKSTDQEALYMYDVNGICSLAEFEQQEDSTQLSSRRSQVINDLVLDMLNATKIIHDLDIIHGDIKLDNFILHKSTDNRLCCKLDDFGEAISYKKHIEIQDKFLQKLGFSNGSRVENDYLLDIPKMLFILNMNFVAPQKHQPEKTLKIYAVRDRIRSVLQYYTQLTDSQIRISASINFRIQKGTPDYSSPQVMALIAKHIDRYLAQGNDFKNSYAWQQYLKNFGTVSAQATYIPSKKNDIYSLGVSVFALIHGILPTSNDPSTETKIVNSEFFRGTLNYDSDARFTIEQAIESWKKEFSLSAGNEAAISSKNKSDLNSPQKKLRLI